jgi:7-cyano-7-deazaguanine synthase in queuosine biosynthesis
MKPQTIPFAFSFWTGASVDAITLQAGKQFRIDFGAFKDFCLGDLPPEFVDLLRISSAVYIADRLVRRRPKKGPKAAARVIGLKIEVLQDSLWNRPEIREALDDVLEFVTGDFWDIEFVRDRRVYEWSKSLACSDESPLICLFSGGLDSVAGLVSRMNENPRRPVVPVTVWHQPRQRHLIRQQYGLLKRHYEAKGIGTQIDPLVVKVAMAWTSATEAKNLETSQRSRSFLFGTVGAITAILNGQQRVEMFESGVGAINLPLMAGMVGPKATRGSHPEFLRRMSKLTSLIAGNELQFALPFEERTKGEVVKALADSGLKTLADASASCVHYPIRHKKYKQCGLCPACIFRRVALASAGIAEPDNAYRYDFLGPAERINALPEARLGYLRAFLLQVAHLADVENRLPPAFERHMVGTGIIQRGQAQKGVARLLARYRDEWTVIAAAARERGHAWARLFAPKRPTSQGGTHASA